MKRPTLYTAFPFYLNSIEHLFKQAGGYGDTKGTITPSHLIHPFQIRTESTQITSITSVTAIEYKLTGEPKGNEIDLSALIPEIQVVLLDSKAYLIADAILSPITYRNYVLKLVYDKNTYYSELASTYNSGITAIPELTDNYIIDAIYESTGFKFYDTSISIASVSNEGTAELDLFQNKIEVISSGTIQNMRIIDTEGINYLFPCIENMHTIHCVKTGIRGILNNYTWSLNGFNNWNQIHGATVLTEAITGNKGFIPYTEENQKLIVI